MHDNRDMCSKKVRTKAEVEVKGKRELDKQHGLSDHVAEGAERPVHRERSEVSASCTKHRRAFVHGAAVREGPAHVSCTSLGTSARLSLDAVLAKRR